MRVAVVDIGTNSTRLLIADVGAGGTLHEVERSSTVTRLGDRVEATGRLGDEPQARVFATLDRYAAAIARHGCDARTAVLTSAVRDAANGAGFAAAVRARYGLEARTLSGDEEAAATYRGATAGRRREDAAPLVVIDIGGGSTELVAGAGDAPEFHVSTQIGVVRHSERHLRGDPPPAPELAALAADVRAGLAAAVPAAVRA
ncbi:MAG TPA: Ppx/GppA family phosphatase, partial [Solirubrobacteraceae bacterium]|nr:Ppx/GppA family phosphatase [Solirubrobacteraceae bacterium]